MKVDGNAKNRRIAGDRRIADPHPIAGAIGVRWVLAERLMGFPGIPSNIYARDATDERTGGQFREEWTWESSSEKRLIY